MNATDAPLLLAFLGTSCAGCKALDAAYVLGYARDMIFTAMKIYCALHCVEYQERGIFDSHFWECSEVSGVHEESDATFFLI